jgi:cardiolipin synthase A/B
MAEIISIVFIVINILLTLSMIFVERKKPQTVLSWTLILTIFPYFGYVFYLLVGYGLSYKTKRMIKRKAIRTAEYKKLLSEEISWLGENKFIDEYSPKYKSLILQNINDGNSTYVPTNKVQYFSSGKDNVESLINDIRNAKKNINICYYIFATDSTGISVLDELTKKAKEGIEVNLLIDSIGSLRENRRKFKKFVKAGGHFAEFFPPLFGFRWFNLRLNYRNHRKIVVIDGKIGYTGGINLRDDHMGKDKKVKPWYDSHVRIEGNGVFGLQQIFLSDWRYATYKKEKEIETSESLKRFFVTSKPTGEAGVQIISSGPESKKEEIKDTYIKMISEAKEVIYIETPYFCPDDSFMDAIRIALNSGVKVKILIPKIADKKFVYESTLSYIGDLYKMGGDLEVYRANGFVHSKVISIDHEVSSVGTCNMDIRSFSINFEDTAIVYDKNFTKKIEDNFNILAKNGERIDKKWYNSLGHIEKNRQTFFRLFSSLF